MADDAIEAQFAAAMAASAARIQAAIFEAQEAARATVNAANIRADADIKVAKIAAAANVQSSTAGVGGAVEAAAIRATADVQSSQVGAAAHTTAAGYQAFAEVGAANIRAGAEQAVGALSAEAQRESASIRAAADVQSANIHALADEAVAGIRANADIRTAGTQADASRFGATQGLAGNQYSSDRQLQGVETREEGEDRRLGVKLGFANARWEEVFPFVQDALTGRTSTLVGSDARWARALASVGQAPAFAASEVWTPQQIQQQLNAAFARSDAKVKSLTRTAEIDLAGRGFAGASPILDAMRLGFEAAGIMGVADEEAKIRIGVAQVNAEQLLKSQSEAIEAHLRSLAAYTELERNAVQLNVGMIGAAAQLLSGVV